MIKVYFIGFFLLMTGCVGAQDFEQIKQELLVIHKEDQTIRYEYIAAIDNPNPSPKTIDSIGKIMQKKDSVNLIRVTKILDSHGWLGKDKIGEDANLTLFLVVQHSNLRTQQKYWPIVRKAAAIGDASKSHLAYLEDRVALGECRMQIYGSQVGQFPDSREYYILPLADPESVDIRRAEVGLQPLGNYVKQWKIAWDPKEYIKALPKIKDLHGL